MSVLTDLRIGETAILVSLDLPDSVQNYLMHMGFVPNAEVSAQRRAPAGDPTVYAIDGMEIALRRETAQAIRVRTVDTPKVEIETQKVANCSPIGAKSEIHEYVGATR